MSDDRVQTTRPMGAVRAAHHLHQSTRNVLTNAPADAEDVIALAIRSGVRFGVRCGCSECDALMAVWLGRIKEALNV